MNFIGIDDSGTTHVEGEAPLYLANLTDEEFDRAMNRIQSAVTSNGKPCPRGPEGHTHRYQRVS